MQTWSSKAQHSGLNKAHFSNTATEKYQEKKKGKKSHTHLEKSIQDTKLKWKGCSPKSRQKINMDLALVFQRHPKSGAALWGRCCVHGRWQRGGAAPGPGTPWDSSGHTWGCLESLGLLPSQHFSSSTSNTVSSSVPWNWQLFLEVFKHQLLQGWV